MEESLPVGNHRVPDLRITPEPRCSRISERYCPGVFCASPNSIGIQAASPDRSTDSRSAIPGQWYGRRNFLAAEFVQLLIAGAGYGPSVLLSLMICQWSSRFTQYWRFRITLW